MAPAAAPQLGATSPPRTPSSASGLATGRSALHRHLPRGRSGPDEPPENRGHSDDDPREQWAEEHPDEPGRHVPLPTLGPTSTEHEAPETPEVTLERVLAPGGIPSRPVDLPFDVGRRQTPARLTSSDALGSHDLDHRRHSMGSETAPWRYPWSEPDGV